MARLVHAVTVHVVVGLHITWRTTMTHTQRHPTTTDTQQSQSCHQHHQHHQLADEQKRDGDSVADEHFGRLAVGALGWAHSQRRSTFGPTISRNEK